MFLYSPLPLVLGPTSTCGQLKMWWLLYRAVYIFWSWYKWNHKNIHSPLSCYFHSAQHPMSLSISCASIVHLLVSLARLKNTKKNSAYIVANNNWWVAHQHVVISQCNTLVEKHLGCFQFLAIINKIDINFTSKSFMDMCFSLEQICTNAWCIHTQMVYV